MCSQADSASAPLPLPFPLSSSSSAPVPVTVLPPQAARTSAIEAISVSFFMGAFLFFFTARGGEIEHARSAGEVVCAHGVDHVAEADRHLIDFIGGFEGHREVLGALSLAALR